MKTFRDNQAREWVVVIHVSAIKRVRALLSVDLYALVDDGFQGLGKLLSDPVGLVDVLYVLCMDEAKTRGITDEDFGRAMAGDAIDAGTTAFLEELTDFFPDPRVRAGLRKVIAASRVVRDRLMDHLASRIDALDPDSEARKLIASSGTSPGPSDSTPDPSRSANSP